MKNQVANDHLTDELFALVAQIRDKDITSLQAVVELRKLIEGQA